MSTRGPNSCVLFYRAATNAASDYQEAIMRNVTIKGIARTTAAWALLAAISACGTSPTAPSSPEALTDQRVDSREADACETTIENGVYVWSCFDDGVRGSVF